MAPSEETASRFSFPPPNASHHCPRNEAQGRQFEQQKVESRYPGTQPPVLQLETVFHKQEDGAMGRMYPDRKASLLP